MTGWLYRLMYRREIRERLERMRAFADEMEHSMAAARAESAQAEDECAAFLADVKAATARGDTDEAEALFAGWCRRGSERRAGLARAAPVDQSWLQVEDK